MNPRHASLLMIIAACLWGTHPVLIQLADWSPLGTAWIRGISCAVVLALYIHLNGFFSAKSPWLQFFCGLPLALNSLLFVSASTYTSPANAVVLMFIFPWVTIALDFMTRGAKPLRGDLFRLTLGLVGIVMIVSAGINGKGTIGDIFALLAGLCIAVHIFFGQRLSERHNGNHEILNAMLIGWLLSCIFLAPFAFSSPVPSSTQMGYLLIFGILSAVPWLLWGKSIAFIPGHVIAALLSVEVFIAALCGWLVLGEELANLTVVGGVLILGAATMQILSGVSKQRSD